ncbi:MAG: tetratricopeptide repeat protein [Candidatus Latescibacteria bacterium]|nr:tetratricopeptide repeat protein [Candidatus Latescibacterota bacterium]
MTRLGFFAIALSLGLQATPSWAVLVANRPQVTIRSDATVQSDKVEVVVQGEELEKVRRKGDWYQVKLPDGRNGWVHHTLVVEREDAPAPKSAKAARSKEARPQAEEPAPSAPARASRQAPAPEPEPAPSSPEPSAEELKRNPYAEGLQHEVEGNYSAALHSFEEALQQDPENLNALVHAAQAHEQLGEYPAALQQLYKALEKSPGNRAVFSRLGEIYQLRSEPDSAGKYQALSRGETPRAPEPASDPAVEPEPPRQPVEDVLWVYLAGVAGVCVLGLGIMWWWHRRGRRAEEEEESEDLPAARPEKGKFAAALEEGAQRSQLRSGEAEELDRRIEDKWGELRQSSAAFMPAELRAKSAAGQAEEAQLDLVLSHLETLRRALGAQEERAHLYRDIMRLQNMKIEAMEEELRLLRRQRRD